MYHSCIINGKNTWDDWHLIPSSRPAIVLPKYKEDYVEIPGLSGSMDNGDLLAQHPTFENRTGTLEFRSLTQWDDKAYMPFHTLQSEIANTISARRDSTIILEDDPQFEYVGRIWLEEFRADNNWPVVIIGYNLLPFKQLVRIPSECNDIRLPGDFSIDLEGSPAYENVEIDVSGAPSDGIQFGLRDQWHWIQNGNNVIFGCYYEPGNNHLRFLGKAAITIQYRGLRL